MAERLKHTLSTHYRGADLELTFDGEGHVSLLINGITRQSTDLETGGTTRLSSTVQTDYEWHEFVEGIVQPQGNAIEAVLIANNAELARQTYA